MTTPNKGGRPSIFGSKVGGTRLQGVITPAGCIRFNAAKRRLGQLAGWDMENISDADVIEFLARGEPNTLKFLSTKQPTNKGLTHGKETHDTDDARLGAREATDRPHGRQ